MGKRETHGRRDHIIPFSLGQKLYNGLRGQKEMFVSETASHSEIPSVEGERYFEAIERLISRTTRLSLGTAK